MAKSVSRLNWETADLHGEFNRVLYQNIAHFLEFEVTKCQQKSKSIVKYCEEFGD